MRSFWHIAGPEQIFVFANLPHVVSTQSASNIFCSNINVVIMSLSLPCFGGCANSSKLDFTRVFFMVSVKLWPLSYLCLTSQLLREDSLPPWGKLLCLQQGSLWVRYPSMARNIMFSLQRMLKKANLLSSHVQNIPLAWNLQDY